MFVMVTTAGFDFAPLKSVCSYPKLFTDVLFSNVMKFWRVCLEEFQPCLLEALFSTRMRDDLFMPKA